MEIAISGAGDTLWTLLEGIKEVIKRYIANQLQEDIAHDQISMRELIDPFTGEPVKKDERSPGKIKDRRLSGSL